VSERRRELEAETERLTRTAADARGALEREHESVLASLRRAHDSTRECLTREAEAAEALLATRLADAKALIATVGMSAAAAKAGGVPPGGSCICCVTAAETLRAEADARARAEAELKTRAAQLEATLAQLAERERDQQRAESEWRLAAREKNEMAAALRQARAFALSPGVVLPPSRYPPSLSPFRHVSLAGRKRARRLTSRPGTCAQRGRGGGLYAGGCHARG
jgi:hypothetical protein